MQPDQGRVTAHELGRRHVRGSVVFAGGRVVSLAFTVATQVAIVRYLSLEAYGIFAFALAVVSAARLVLSLGQGNMLSRFLSVYDEQGRPSQLVGSLVLGISTILMTTVLGALLLLSLGGEITSSLTGPPDPVVLLLVLAWLAPLEALDELFIAVFAVFTKARSIFVRKYLLTPGLRLAVVLAMIAAEQDVVFLAVGYVAAQVVALGVYAVMLVRILRARGLLGYVRPRRLEVPVRAVFALALPSLTGTFVYLSMNTGSVVLLSMFWGAAEIAVYRAVFPAARLNQFVFTAFTTLYLPMASRLFARGDTDAARDAYWHTAVLLVVFSFPVFAMTTVFSSVTTVALFGERYADASVVLALLSLGYYLNVALGFNAHTLSVYGRGRRLVVINTVSAVVNLVLCAVLVPRHGAAGVAGANCLTLVAQNVLNQWALRRSLATPFVSSTALRPYGWIAVLCVALWGVQVMLDPGVVSASFIVLVSGVLLLFLTRRALRLKEMFPELARVPVLRYLVAGAKA